MGLGLQGKHNQYETMVLLRVNGLGGRSYSNIRLFCMLSFGWNKRQAIEHIWNHQNILRKKKHVFKDRAAPGFLGKLKLIYLSKTETYWSNSTADDAGQKSKYLGPRLSLRKNNKRNTASGSSAASHILNWSDCYSHDFTWDIRHVFSFSFFLIIFPNIQYSCSTSNSIPRWQPWFLPNSSISIPNNKI